MDEVVLGQPGEAGFIDVEMGQRGPPRALGKQGADRLALVQAERGDVDQADDIGCILAESRDDLATIGVTDNDHRPALARQNGAQPGNVVGQPWVESADRRECRRVFAG
nr:hypothetical protein [Microlunatus sp. Gsoil 973]